MVIQAGRGNHVTWPSNYSITRSRRTSANEILIRIFLELLDVDAIRQVQAVMDVLLCAVEEATILLNNAELKDAGVNSNGVASFSVKTAQSKSGSLFVSEHIHICFKMIKLFGVEMPKKIHNHKH